MGRRTKKKPKCRAPAASVLAPPSRQPSAPATNLPSVKKRQMIADATEVLDGNAYEDCTFARCRIVYKGGQLPVLSGCNFDDCSWDLDEAAHRTLDYLRGIYHGMGPDGQRLIEQTFEMIRERPHGDLPN